MTWRARLLVGAVLVCTVVSQGAVSAARSQSLAGRTTFVNPGHASIVRLRSELRLPEVKSPGEIPGLEIRGAGKVVALVGTYVEGRADRPTFVMTRIRDCENERCSKGRDFEFARVVGGDGQVRVPPGEYRVYLVAEDPKASVTVVDEASGGRRTIRLSRPADAAVTKPTVRVHEPTTKSIYSNGDVYDFDGSGGIVFGALELRGGLWAAGRHGTCIYEEMPPDPLAFAPGCPFGFSASVVDAVVRTETDRIGFSIGVLNGRGEWGFGSFYEAAAEIEEVTASGFRIGLD